MWTVVLIRPLGLTDADDKRLKAGGADNVGFAVHDGNITTRGHHVTFVKTLGLDTKAGIEAVKLPWWFCGAARAVAAPVLKRVDCTPLVPSDGQFVAEPR